MLAVRTSAEIKAEIQAKFGFVPSFFEPAEQSPQVFENLWQQTLLAYVTNPLTPLFKEKLSAYLSRYCAVPYCMVCHSCSLRPLGMQAKEVLELLESPPPTELEVDKHLKQLAAYSGQLTILPEPHSPMEESLLACSIFIALEQEQAEYCRVELRRLLGPENYQHLVTFSAYVKTCHAWMEAHPEVAYETDQRVLDHLGALLAEAPGLQQFFDTYVDRIRQERRHWAERRAERLAELREQKRQEQRFRLLTEAIPQQVWTAQPDGRLDYVNQRILNYFDRSFEEMIGWGWQTVIHPEDLPYCLKNWQTALATGAAYEIEFRLKSIAGEYRWHLGRALPLRDEQGEIISWFGTNTDIHDRKQAEAELQRSNQAVTNILESITDAFFALDHEWRFTYVNGQAELLLQRSRQELLESNLWQEFPDAVNSTFEWEYRRAMSEQVSVEFEAFYPSLNTWFAVHAYPSGTGLAVYFQDINERKQAEHNLQETTTLQRAILDSANYTIISTAEDGTILTFNRAAERLLGYRAAEVVGKTTPVIIHDLQEVVQRAAELSQELGTFIEPGFEAFVAKVRRGVVDEREWTYIRKDGSRCPVLLSITALRDEAGRITGFLGIGSDLTLAKQLEAERRQTQVALRESEERLESILSSLKDIVWSASATTQQMLYLNPAAEAIYGYPRSKFFEDSNFWLKVVHPEDCERVRQAAENLINTGLKKLEYRILRPDGEVRWLLDRGQLLYDSEGRPSRIDGIASDITDRKLAEAEIQQLNETLEQRVKERTAQLEAANQELDSFSYSVSHDLRAPLRHISGFVTALQQRLEHQGSLTDPKVTHYLEVIQSSSQKMGQLIDGLLTLSRLGRRQLTQYPVELGQLVQAVITQTQGPTGYDPNRQVEFQVASLPTVMGDATLLQQVFSNLIDNAVKFSRHACPARVTIGALADGTLFVQDNGVGFQMEHADQLFGPFQRLHSQQEFEGTGIGLAIVQRIVHRHGGAIWAQSQPGQGATFYLKLRPVATRSRDHGC